MAKKHKKPSFFPALLSVTMVLFMLGLLGLLVISSNRFTNYLKENVMFTVYFSNAAPDERLASISGEIQSMDFVKSSVFISKEEAAEVYKKEINVDFEETLGENPLPASLDIYVKATHSDSATMRKTMDRVAAMDYVQDVDYQGDLIRSINKFRERISFILAGITLILVFISIILITNTVRLSVFANRFLIKSMQMVGATEWFIIRPFINRAFLIGALGSVFAGGLLLIAFLAASRWIAKEFPQFAGSAGEAGTRGNMTHWTFLMQDISQYSILFVILLVLGVAILVISTYVSTKKYLKLKIDDLY